MILGLLILLTLHPLANAGNQAKADSQEKKFFNLYSHFHSLLANGENDTDVDSQGDEWKHFYAPDITSYNFNKHVYNGTKASLVQFYSRKCTSCFCDCDADPPSAWFGYGLLAATMPADNRTFPSECECEKFHRSWDYLGYLSTNWISPRPDRKPVLTIKQINCADNRNTRLCRQYGITKYPTIRYFPPALKTFYPGRDFKNIHEREFFEELLNLIRPMLFGIPPKE